MPLFPKIEEPKRRSLIDCIPSCSPSPREWSESELDAMPIYSRSPSPAITAPSASGDFPLGHDSLSVIPKEAGFRGRRRPTRRSASIGIPSRFDRPLTRSDVPLHLPSISGLRLSSKLPQRLNDEARHRNGSTRRTSEMAVPAVNSDIKSENTISRSGPLPHIHVNRRSSSANNLREDTPLSEETVMSTGTMSATPSLQRNYLVGEHDMRDYNDVIWNSSGQANKVPIVWIPPEGFVFLPPLW